ncbi:MAG: FG-GAP-like repeat-containing protein [Phycisphaerales bacterium]|nr:VCBS repeat-containing protein [Planctomycetota bacterium]MCH8509259.1 FG-GAP-like repeat-containing protein [Phycisphaerales bacterium]
MHEIRFLALAVLLLLKGVATAQEVRFSTTFEEIDFAANLIAIDTNGNGRDELVGWAINPLRYAVLSFDPGGGITVSPTQVIGGDGAVRVSTGDLNSDGLDDLVFLPLFESQIIVLLSNGDTTFSNAPGSPVPATDVARAIRVVDADLDGFKDILLATSNSIIFYKGRNDGGFDFPTAFHTGIPTVRDMVFADFRGDGNPVLAVISANRSIHFFERDGQTFTEYQVLPAGDWLLRAEAIDVDNAGSIRLVIAAENNQRVITVGWDENAQEYSVLHRSTRLNSGTTSVAFGDLNGNGIDDVVYGVKDVDALRVFYADPDGSGLYTDSGTELGRFERLSGVAVADIDGNGVNELILAGFKKTGVMVLRPDATSGLRAATYSSPNPSSFGRLLAYEQPDGTPAVYAMPEDFSRAVHRLTFSEIDGQFEISAEQVDGADFVTLPTEVATGDLNNDGLVDLYSLSTVNTTRRIQWQLATPEGGFGIRLNRQTEAVVFNLTVADFNGDGYDDAAVLDQSGNVRIFFARDGGSLDPPTIVPMTTDGFSLRSLLAKDLDGDGWVDLACFARPTSQTSVLIIRYGRGDGTFDPPVSFSSNVGVGQTLPGWIDAADFNSNGQLDIIAAQAKSSHLFLSTGIRTYGPVVLVSEGPSLFRVEAVDLNGDGRPEIATVFDGYTEIVEVTPDGAIGPRRGLYQNPPVGSVFVDVNADGLPDLVSASKFDTAVSFNVSHAACLPDLNGDGVVNFFDLAIYIALFNAGDPDADLNNDGQLNFFDLAAYLTLFNQGCP